MKRTVISMIVIISLLLTTMLSVITVQAAEKKQTKRAIAIVFDNSGSMYGYNQKDDTIAWCRATYAMEVFASMANVGDDVVIYPMNPIQIGSAQYTSQEPYKLSGGNDMTSIEKIYTPSATFLATPIEAVRNAYAGLSQMNADEKWLVVLTDGNHFHENYVALSPEKTNEMLTAELTEFNNNVNVMYLGIGSGVSMPTISGSQKSLTAQAQNTSEVLSKLTEMCNSMYGRDILQNKENTIAFDISMKKIILFVQGDNIENLILEDSSGNEVGTPVSSVKVRYSDNGTDWSRAECDPSLSGMLVTYTNLVAGMYELNYSGNSSSISVYYEPDVDLMLKLETTDGQEIQDFDLIYPGEYQLHYGFADSSGKFVDSSLLGDKTIELNYSVNGAANSLNDTKSGIVGIALDAGFIIEAEADGSYLSGYTTHADMTDFGWPIGGIQCANWPAGELVGIVEGGQDIYSLAELPEKAVYKYSLVYNGVPLTKDEYSNIDFDLGFAGENSLSGEVIKSDDGIYVGLDYLNDDPKQTAIGDYSMVASVDFVDENDNAVSCAFTSQNFSIENVEYSLTATMTVLQDYYVASKMEEGEPIELDLLMDGQPLTEEQMDNLALDVDAGDLDYTVEKDYENSKALIHLDANEDTEYGDGKVITASAKTIDDMGREVESNEEEGEVEVQPYAKILRTLFWIFLLLLLIGIIIAILMLKRLPKKIMVKSNSFSVDGTPVSGSASCSYTGKNKKRGSLTLISPRCPTNVLAKCGVTLDLLAGSCLKDKSASRVVIVTGVHPVNAQNIQNIKVGAASFVKNEQGQFIKSGTKSGDKKPLEIPISNGAKIMASGIMTDENETSISFNVVLKYM